MTGWPRQGAMAAGTGDNCGRDVFKRMASLQMKGRPEMIAMRMPNCNFKKCKLLYTTRCLMQATETVEYNGGQAQNVTKADLPGIPGHQAWR